MGFRFSGRLTHLLPLALWVTGAASCVAVEPGDGAEGIDGTAEAVVYDVDNRTDVYEASAANAQIARGSVVSLIETELLDVSDPSHVVVRPEAGTLGPTYRLCSEERFRDQPVAAHCTATLIDDDLILTAGHCVRTIDDCRAQYFVFGYVMDDATTLGDITRADIFTCRNLLVRQEGFVDGARVDYAVIQLDRPATPVFDVRPVEATLQATVGDPVTVIGTGSGLPLKVDTGGTIREANGPNSFRLDSDTFHGNSGSGVLRPDGTLFGILVRGREDYGPDGSCNRVRIIPRAGLPNDTESIRLEEATYAARAIGHLCAADGGHWLSSRLCGNANVCGDGFCGGSETNASCRQDCPADRCGDRICQLHEDATCPTDCIERHIRTVPESWTCAAGLFANQDGCQCECGAPDPDCTDTWQELSGCAPDQFCSAHSAHCVSRTQWTCSDSYYEDGQCDCGCGTLADPDCSDPHAPSAPGCQDPPTCSAPPMRLGAGAGFGWIATAAVAVALGARRRRRR